MEAPFEIGRMGHKDYEPQVDDPLLAAAYRELHARGLELHEEEAATFGF